MDLPGISAHPSLVVAGVLLIVYCVYGAVHRLFLSPIAHFPGPRLAALTFWYEFYYDVVRSGRYTWRIAEMHKKYGDTSRLPLSSHCCLFFAWLICYRKALWFELIRTSFT